MWAEYIPLIKWVLSLIGGGLLVFIAAKAGHLAYLGIIAHDRLKTEELEKTLDEKAVQDATNEVEKFRSKTPDERRAAFKFMLVPDKDN